MYASRLPLADLEGLDREGAYLRDACDTDHGTYFAT
jgi:hypothetical protein